MTFSLIVGLDNGFAILSELKMNFWKLTTLRLSTSEEIPKIMVLLIKKALL